MKSLDLYLVSRRADDLSQALHHISRAGVGEGQAEDV